MKKIPQFKITAVHNELKRKGNLMYLYGGVAMGDEIVDNLDTMFGGFSRKQQAEYVEMLAARLSRIPYTWTLSFFIFYANQEMDYHDVPFKGTVRELDTKCTEYFSSLYNAELKKYEDSKDEDGNTKQRRPISTAWHAVPSATFKIEPKIREIIDLFDRKRFFDAEHCALMSDKIKQRNQIEELKKFI